MKKKLLCLLLAACLLLGVLSGCGGITRFEDLEYERPDTVKLNEALEKTCAAAGEETDVEELMDLVYDYYDQYHWFYTNYSLANVYYSKDLTDIYWEKEYNYCMEKSAEVDGGYDRLMYALADSPLREELEKEEYFGEGYFDGYEGESIWDDQFTALMEQEAQLINEYYSLSAGEYTAQLRGQLEDVFVRLVKLRYQIARYAGYDSYVDFAYDFYYYRDYTPAQERILLEEIKEQLVPIYLQMARSDVWNLWGQYCEEEDVLKFAKNAVNKMGGTLAEAFRAMERGGLYDISYGENKFAASFETYLSYYGVPFVFMNPQGSVPDKLTLLHEFGHFANDYACEGSYAGVDVAEIYSQGLEFLSLCYGEDTEDLAKVKMADSLSVYVEQAAYASFEQGVYALKEAEITKDRIAAVMGKVLREYGLSVWGIDARDYVQITHFFTNPMYVISYVVSNDAALQIYAMEKEQKGKGLELYQQSLTSQEAYFLAFLEETGLEDPFTEGRMETMKTLFEEIFE